MCTQHKEYLVVWTQRTSALVGWHDVTVLSCCTPQAARTLLTFDDKETKRLFEGEALLRRMYKYGLLEESQNKLDYVLALTPQDFLERRLQTLVFKLGLAKSMPPARVRIRQRHIRCALPSCCHS